MHFQPIDENSLRHLFSSSYAEDILKMSYLGPVVNESGEIEMSPDCLILDKREKQWRTRRCEFKYTAHGKGDFAQNGNFDIAIVWSISPPLTKQSLLEDLSDQNGCQEIIILNERKAFHDLEKYSIADPKRLNGIEELRRIILKSRKIKYATVFVAFIAAKIYPKKFEIGKLVNVLSNKFPEVRKMHPQGRANVVSALIQTKPPLIRIMHGRVYCWNDSINAHLAVKEMEEIIRTRFYKDIPSSDIIDSLKEND